MTAEGKLGEFAASVLLKASSQKLLELFLCQLPSLFSSRQDLIMLFDAAFDNIYNALVELTDPISGVCLLSKFQAYGIPNFLIAQSTSLLESFAAKPLSLRPHDHDLKAQQAAVSLALKVWAAFPSCLCSPQFAFDSSVDKSLENQARKLISQQSQPGEVLHLLKQSAMMNLSLPLRLCLIQGLFSLHAKMMSGLELIDCKTVARTIFKTLTFFLVEWHKDRVLRTALVKEF